MKSVKNVKETRRDHVRRLVDGYPSQRQFAEALGLSAAHVSQMLTGVREVGSQVARRIEAALGLAEGFLDTALGAAAAPLDQRGLLNQILPADQIKLLNDYMQLSPKRQEMLRDTAAGFAKLEQVQQQQQQ